MNEPMVSIIGLGIGALSTLSESLLEKIRTCQILIGAKRYLEQIDGIEAQKVPITANLFEIIETINNNPEKKVVILASGDPNLFGISDFILKNIPFENVEIHTNISSMQAAFAAAKISMNDAVITSVHGRDINAILDTVRCSSKIGIFTSSGETPFEIVQTLKDKTSFDFDIYVCEDLGFETEKITKTTVSEMSDLKFSPLNIMILIKKETEQTEPKKEKRVVPLIGLSDEEFSFRDGMITKSEIRALNISKLCLKEKTILWDIGAGCGSISVEASSIAYNGKIFAIEKEEQQIGFINQNIEKFDRSNIEVIHSEAPQSLEDLPSPDRIFIGGSGGNLRSILHVASERLLENGIVVINAVTLNTLIEGTAVLKEMDFNVEVYSVNFSKTKDLNGTQLFRATNPVYIITGKPP